MTVMFSIKPMQSHHLPGVMAVQIVAYHEIEPESLAVMERKWELSPQSCFVALADNEVKGYVLAHPWRAESIPVLYSVLDVLPADADSLYLHDLALLPEWRGRHVAVELFKNMRNAAIDRGYRGSHLVSIQSSMRFWEKMGYRKAENIACQLETYPPGTCPMRQEWAR